MITINGKSLLQRKQEVMDELSSIGSKVKSMMSEANVPSIMARLKKALKTAPKLRL